MNRVRSVALLALLLAAAPGCEGRREPDAVVPIDKVPAAAMDAVRKELPGLSFEAAYKGRVDGRTVYEVKGKDRRGKIREVEVMEAGEVE